MARGRTRAAVRRSVPAKQGQQAIHSFQTIQSSLPDMSSPNYQGESPFDAKPIARPYPQIRGFNQALTGYRY